MPSRKLKKTELKFSLESCMEDRSSHALCTNCQHNLFLLAAMHNWSSLLEALLEKEMNGVSIPDSDTKVPLGTTVEQLLGNSN